MTSDEYKTIARRIHDVAKAPQSKDSVEATADDLARLCSVHRMAGEREICEEEQALRVMQAIRDEWDEWRGPKGIRDCYFALFSPRPEQRPFSESAPMPKCDLCNDTGWRVVKRGEAEGVEKCDHAQTDRPN